MVAARTTAAAGLLNGSLSIDVVVVAATAIGALAASANGTTN